MKKKKQSYEFGNSNYRKMKVATKNKTWIHLEKDDEGNLFGYMAHPDNIEFCFESKKIKAKTGSTNCKLSNMCILKCMGQAFTKDVKEIFKTSDSDSYEFCNIDDFFKVELLSDREYMGYRLPDDCCVASITC